MVISKYCLMSVALFAFFAGATQAADVEGELAACSAIEGDTERLACYDAIGKALAAPAEAANVPPTMQPSPQTAPTPTPTPTTASAPAPTPTPTTASAPAPGSAMPAPVAENRAVVELPNSEQIFGMNAGEIRREQQRQFGQEDLRQIEAKVVKLRTRGNHKLEITLDNDQVWEQVASSYLRLKVGEDVIIKRAALDSYRLVKVGNNRPMQVRRIQ